MATTYDENGGSFDHVTPPTPAPGTPGEFVTVPDINAVPGSGGIRGPIGLGFRVPTFVISPYSRGPLERSTVLDHTSQLKLLRTRFGAPVPNLSRHRRGHDHGIQLRGSAESVETQFEAPVAGGHPETSAMRSQRGIGIDREEVNPLSGAIPADDADPGNRARPRNSQRNLLNTRPAARAPEIPSTRRKALRANASCTVRSGCRRAGQMPGRGGMLAVGGTRNRSSVSGRVRACVLTRISKGAKSPNPGYCPRN